MHMSVGLYCCASMYCQKHKDKCANACASSIQWRAWPPRFSTIANPTNLTKDLHLGLFMIHIHSSLTLSVDVSSCQMGFWNEQQSFMPGKCHNNQHDSQPYHNNRCCACPNATCKAFSICCFQSVVACSCTEQYADCTQGVLHLSLNHDITGDVSTGRR